jgi:hypothetical protein
MSASTYCLVLFSMYVPETHTCLYPQYRLFLGITLLWCSFINLQNPQRLDINTPTWMYECSHRYKEKYNTEFKWLDCWNYLQDKQDFLQFARGNISSSVRTLSQIGPAESTHNNDISLPPQQEQPQDSQEEEEMQPQPTADVEVESVLPP